LKIAINHLLRKFFRKERQGMPKDQDELQAEIDSLQEEIKMLQDELERYRSEEIGADDKTKKELEAEKKKIKELEKQLTDKEKQVQDMDMKTFRAEIKSKYPDVEIDLLQGSKEQIEKAAEAQQNKINELKKTKPGSETPWSAVPPAPGGSPPTAPPKPEDELGKIETEIQEASKRGDANLVAQLIMRKAELEHKLGK